MKPGAQSGSLLRRKGAGDRGASLLRSSRLAEVMAIAKNEGLLRGERTRIVRGRMPQALVARAKDRTGINSDTDLIEVALANIAVADDYADWLLSRRGAVDGEAVLEF